jgi:phosphoenolpyruvate synthase/pyruvate phosphate dikinase
VKGRIYVLNTKNIKDKDFELVGSGAIDNSILMTEGILTPPSFVVTSIAFDDFLTSANLVESIARSLAKVRPFIRETARDASEEISSLILNAKFPSIMAEPIAYAYQNLVDHNEQPIVSMIPSHIIDQQFIPNAKSITENVVIKGINDLLYNIKLAWLSMFTTEAIETRSNTYYQGAISLGLIIQKKVRPEVSGLAYSVEHDQINRNISQVNALYGVEHSSILINNSDTYKVNKKDSKVIERNIMPQEYMYVTKLKFEKNEDPYIKVEISPAWKNTQKIDDSKIINISKIVSKIETKFNTPVELNWGIETGDIYVLNIRPQIITEAKPKLKDQKEQKSKIHTELDGDKKKDNTDKPNIKELTEEIQAIVENKTSESMQSSPSITDEIEEEVRPEETRSELTRSELTRSEEIATAKPITLPKVEQDKNSDNIKLQQTNGFNIRTPLYLDISTMNSRVLTALNNFSGSFFDATEMVLNNNVLPEEYRGNNAKLGELIEKYATDISIAAKSAGAKQLIYQFSTISEYELKLLGVDEGKYRYNHDERFIDYPEALTVEAIAIKKALSNYDTKNLSICFPGIRNLNNLEDLKKVITTQGLKKNANLKFYCEVAIPSFIFEFDKIGKSDINGIIVNYTKLLKLTTFRTELRDIDHSVGFKELQLLKTLTSEKNMELFVRMDNYADHIIDEVIKLNPTGIIFTNVPSKKTLENIEHMEGFFFKEKPRNPYNRGRKIKDLF